MLTGLSVKNFTLIEDLFLEFSGGLNVLTGETGAGKTIVIEALGLALGEKAGSHQVRKGASRLSVAATFNRIPPRLKKLLDEMNLASEERDDELLLRREVDAGGRSRAFVNDRPVGLSTLARLGEVLVDFHGQHEHQLLLKAGEQRDFLDTFGHLEDPRAAVQTAYARWRDLASQQEAASLSEQERAQRVDLYRFQVKELAEAALKSGEEEELERLLPQLKNAERLKVLAGEAYGWLYGEEGSGLDKVRRVKRSLQSLQELGADLGDAVEMVDEALVRLEDAAQGLDAFQGRVESDPQRLEEVLGRLDLIARLKRKYGPTLDQVIAYRAKIEDELDRLENAEERRRDLAEKLAQAEKELKAQSVKLSQARSAAAKKLGDAVQKELKDLGFHAARLEISVVRSEEPAYSAAGIDAVQFLFSPNPGEGLEPLSKIASGGELSRVMLALRTVLARTDHVGTLVFDEIDAGVGGTMGQVLGKKLARLGKTYQVLCITHLAAIAAGAETHFAVEKEIKGDRTRSVVRRLEEEERVAEIARMLGGADAGRPGKESVSLQHARVLLAESKT
jgi:DNA repair protein RecN (Recombination protein N)